MLALRIPPIIRWTTRCAQLVPAAAAGKMPAHHHLWPEHAFFPRGVDFPRSVRVERPGGRRSVRVGVLLVLVPRSPRNGPPTSASVVLGSSSGPPPQRRDKWGAMASASPQSPPAKRRGRGPAAVSRGPETRSLPPSRHVLRPRYPVPPKSWAISPTDEGDLLPEVPRPFSRSGFSRPPPSRTMPGGGRRAVPTFPRKTRATADQRPKSHAFLPGASTSQSASAVPLPFPR